MKKYISERIINISDLEVKIKEARYLSDNLIKSLENKNYPRAEYLSSNLSLKLHELDNFEFIVEKREVRFISDCNHQF
ncbi:hypothetical protein ACQQ2T_08905 [Paraclostridium tenue]